MLGFIRALKFGAAIMATTMLLECLLSPVQNHRGSSHENAKVGFIVGVGGGGGTLTYHGRTWLSVGGVSVGTIGVASANLVGTAYHLHNAADIAGTYVATSASIAVVGGGKVATLQNEKGVILKVHGVQAWCRGIPKCERDDFSFAIAREHYQGACAVFALRH